MKLRKRDPHELESYSDYGRVVLQISDRTRVIECRDGVQWIVQRGHPVKGALRWDGMSFCRTKEALLRCCSVRPGENAILDALPEWLTERAAGRRIRDNGVVGGVSSQDDCITATSDLLQT